jgi:Zn-dependent peptidase ImmA (M78 family)
MDYSKLKIKPLSNQQIREAADKIRAKFWGEKIPVDIENILEVGLKISIIPSPGLQDRGDVDSFISSDWRNVYVDNDKYFNDRHYRRIRFSLAHELGHFILHREIFESLEIKSLADYYHFYSECPQEQYNFLEAQANKFAGYLLMPPELLAPYKLKYLTKARKQLIGTTLENIDDIDLIGFISGDIADIFNVSAQAMEIGLKS